MKIKNSFFIIFLLFSYLTFAQEKKEDVKIFLKIKNSKNKPVPGAIILFDNVKYIRKTNAKGELKVKLSKPPKEISAFSPTIGIKKVVYTGNNQLTIVIKEGNEKITTDTPKEKNVDPIQFRNIYDYLRGKVSGVRINSNNVITIRGYNTINGNTTPLFILNNTQVDQNTFGDIVPTTIKSIEILKGPLTAQYGARGANGVIKVTTF